MRQLYLFAFLSFVSLTHAQDPADIDLDFSATFPANYFSYCNLGKHASTNVAAGVQSDGKIIVNSGNGLQRVTNNLIDSSFNAGGLGFESNLSYANYQIDNIVVLPDDKILVSGSFDKYNGVAVGHLIRLNSNGTLDQSFSGVTTANEIAAQADGKVLVIGTSSLTSSFLMRFDANGQFDATFNPVPPASSNFLDMNMVVQADAKIVVSYYLSVVRYNNDGSVDNTFLSAPITGQNEYLKALGIQADGKLLIGGSFTAYNGTSVKNLVRLNNDGTVDTGFTTPANINITLIRKIVTDNTGKILIYTPDYSLDAALAVHSILRFNNDGSLDTTLNDRPINYYSGSCLGTVPVIDNIIPLSTGQILVLRTGNCQSNFYQYDGIVRINNNGSPDTSFNNGAGVSGNIRAIIVQPDGKVLIGGDFTSFNAQPAILLIRLNSDGTRDTSFNTELTSDVGGVYDIALQADGKILIAGAFGFQHGAIYIHYFARLNADGSVDDTFNPGGYGFDGYIYSIAVQQDGKILAGGRIGSYNNVAVGKGLIRLDSNGSVDSSFNVGAGFYYNANRAAVSKLAIKADGTIWVSGLFNKYRNTIYNKSLLLLNTDGSVNQVISYFSPGDNINAISVQPDGTTLLAGGFGSRIIGLNNFITTYGTYFDDSINAIAAQPDGKILVGGKFSATLPKFARLKGLTFGLDYTYNSGIGFNNDVNAIALQSDGKIWVAGNFTTYKGSKVRRLVRLNGDHFYNINGSSKLDTNVNGCDASDAAFSFLKLEISNGPTQIGNSLGNYSCSITPGSHTITPVFENPDYFSATPSSVTVDFPSQASPLVQNFCITPNGSHPDLEVSIIPISSARPGFDAKYRLIYKNKGNQIQSGTIALSYDSSALALIFSNPAATNQGFNLSWNFANLNPFETRNIDFTLNLNSPTETPPLNAGSILDLTVVISSPLTDEIPSDNTFAFQQVVVNAIDPNVKTCLEGTTITTEKVGDYVHYTIHFENTGTANATNVLVKDIIDASKYDISSLVPVSGSHVFSTKITGNNVEFLFQNINLNYIPGINDGYAAFKIKTKSTLVAGDSFSNTAGIYFDYNSAVDTNTATTMIAALSVKDFAFDRYFTVYPNPVNDQLNIDKKQDIEITSMSVYNTLGQLLITIPNARQVPTIDVSGLKSGHYFIRINSDKGISIAKFIKL